MEQYDRGGLGAYLLSGEVGADAIAGLSSRVLVQEQPLAGIRYEVDCTGVTGFTAEALVSLCELIKSLRASGGDLVLRGLRPEARSGVLERLAQAWLPPQLADELLEFARSSQALAAHGPWKYISQN